MSVTALPLPEPEHFEPPGAALDSQPWARSWPAYLRAVNDPWDSTARTFIASAMSERIPAEGGFLVPEILRQQVLAYMTPSIMRPRAMVLPMSSLRLPIPTLDNPTQASSTQVLGGLTFSFAEEGAAIAATNPAFGRTVLEARKLAAYMQNVSNELVDDAGGAFGDFLARVIGMGLAWVEDDYFLGSNGTGAGVPQAIFNAPCAVSVTRTGGTFALADLATMVKGLHPASKQAGFTSGVTDVCWLVSSPALDTLLEIYLSVGTPPSGADVSPSDWFSLGDGDKVAPSLLGLPVIVTDHQPNVGTAGDIVLADLRHYLIGDRLTMTVERSQESNFIGDVSNFRVKSRLDGRYWIQSATTTTAGQSVSPVVVLH